jgi:hypothetical protein
MPIRRLLEHNDAFSPEDVQVLVGAFDDTLRALNLTDRERPIRMMVAKLIIEFAQQGERDIENSTLSISSVLERERFTSAQPGEVRLICEIEPISASGIG